ncbi:hypothetical protein [Mycobacterium sp.]|uniref:hypothetical protein n=1 Tax=Mycobacterium sp. TaxID=1785 RepID=UPI002C7F4A16|nr:hypothetical protein [Mycobacterium sp.]HTY31905.1 hypothetical protein [Mycobacterium sp.]
MNEPVYNPQNEGAMYTAPSPFDDPTTPIDAQALRAWWARQRRETQAMQRRKPQRVAFIRQRW